MKITNVQSPCIDCKDRNINCHSECKQYKKFKFLCQIERQKNYEEKEIDATIGKIISDGVNSRRTNTPEQLKHGRKK